MVRGILEVFLIDAKGLHNTEFLGKMDPNVLIQCRDHEYKSSVARDEPRLNLGGTFDLDQGSNPVWSEKFIFPVQFPRVDDHCKLMLRILEKDTFSNDDFAGETTISLKELIAGEENGVAEAKPCAYTIVLADRTYCGQILVGLIFTITGEDFN